MDAVKDWLLEKKRYLPWAIVGILLVFNLVTFMYEGRDKETEQEDIPEELFYEGNNQTIPTETAVAEETPIEESDSVQKETPPYVFADIKGAVHAPGVYEMENDDRIVDLVDKAQGFTEEADVVKINLAQKIEDQMMVYIPREGEEVEENILHDSPSVESGEEREGEGGLVNINTADLSSLMTLNGIGEKKAQSILDYREENGSFQTIEDIKNISGIGDKSFENIKDSITVTK